VQSSNLISGASTVTGSRLIDRIAYAGKIHIREDVVIRKNISQTTNINYSAYSSCCNGIVSYRDTTGSGAMLLLSILVRFKLSGLDDLNSHALKFNSFEPAVRVQHLFNKDIETPVSILVGLYCNANDIRRLNDLGVSFLHYRPCLYLVSYSVMHIIRHRLYLFTTCTKRTATET